MTKAAREEHDRTLLLQEPVRHVCEDNKEDACRTDQRLRGASYTKVGLVYFYAKKRDREEGSNPLIIATDDTGTSMSALWSARSKENMEKWISVFKTVPLSRVDVKTAVTID